MFTVSEALLRFVENYVWMHGYAKSTENNYRWVVNSFISVCGDVELNKITLYHIKEWKKHMEANHWEVNAQNAYMYRMRLLLRYWAKKTELSIDPEDILIPKKKQSLPKFLKIEDIKKLIEAGDSREKVIISLLYSSGIRVGELVQVRIRDVEGDQIKIRGKGNKERIVFIDGLTRSLVASYVASRTDTCPFLLYSKKIGGLGVGRVQQLVRELGIKAKLNTPITPHILRHSFATHLLQHGMNIKYIQELLGHADISTTQIYLHTALGDIKRDYDKVFR